jgi:hypothetical protein
VSRPRRAGCAEYRGSRPPPASCSGEIGERSRNARASSRRWRSVSSPIGLISLMLLRSRNFLQRALPFAGAVEDDLRGADLAFGDPLLQDCASESHRVGALQSAQPLRFRRLRCGFDHFEVPLLR